MNYVVTIFHVLHILKREFAPVLKPRSELPRRAEQWTIRDLIQTVSMLSQQIAQSYSASFTVELIETVWIIFLWRWSIMIIVYLKLGVGIHLGVPLKLGVGTPEKQKRNSFALKHFLEPIYQKKNIFILEFWRGGVLPMIWKIPELFWFGYDHSFYPALHWRVSKYQQSQAPTNSFLCGDNNQSDSLVRAVINPKSSLNSLLYLWFKKQWQAVLNYTTILIGDTWQWQSNKRILSCRLMIIGTLIYNFWRFIVLGFSEPLDQRGHLLGMRLYQRILSLCLFWQTINQLRSTKC